MNTTPSAAPIALFDAPQFDSLTNRDGWEARTHWDLPENHRLRITTYKSGHRLTTTANVFHVKHNEGYSSECHTMGMGMCIGDYSKRIFVSEPKRVTEKVVKAQHEMALHDCFDEVLAKVVQQYGFDMKLPGAQRPIYKIALEIERLWKEPYFGAVPYLDAMRSVISINDSHGVEDGKTQVLYFLSNANTWRGDDAKRIKAELKSICGIK